MNNISISATEGFVDSILPVSLDADTSKEFEAYIFPYYVNNRDKVRPNDRKVPNGPVQFEFVDLLQNINEIMTQLNVGFAILKNIAVNNDKYVEEQDGPSFADYHSRIVANIAGALEENVVAPQMDAFLQMLKGSFHTIRPSQRFVGGYDICWTGKPCSYKASPLLGAKHHLSKVKDLNPLTCASDYDMDKGLAVEAVKKAQRMLNVLTNGQVTLSNAHSRQFVQIPLTFDFTQFNNLIFDQNADFKATVPIFPHTLVKSNISANLQTCFGKYFSILLVYSPSNVLVENAAAALRSGKGFRNEQVMCEQALALEPNLSMSLVLHLPKEFVAYITQTPINEKPVLSSLNSWVTLWKRYAFRVADKKKKSKEKDAGHKVTGSNSVPRYILKASALNTLVEKRKDFGMSIEEGCIDKNSIFVSNNGSLNYMIGTTQSTDLHAKEHENTLDEIIEFCGDLNMPVDFSAEVVDDAYVVEVGKLSILDDMTKMHRTLTQSAGKLLGYSWDFNTALFVSQKDPSQIASVDLSGARCPDDLAIADYMKKPFAECMRLMMPSCKANLPDGSPVATAEHWGANANQPELMLNQIPMFSHLFNLYELLVNQKKAATFQELVSKAAAHFHIKTLTDNEDVKTFEEGIYHTVLSSDLKDAIGKGLPECQKILSVMSTALKEAAASPGTRHYAYLLAQHSRPESVVAALPNSPRYFDVSPIHRLDRNKKIVENPLVCRADQFANVYKYVGGYVFYLMLLEVKRSLSKFLYKVEFEDDQLPFALGPEGKKILPPYTVVSRQIAPFIQMCASYIPDSEQVYERAKVLEARNERSPDINVDDLLVPGTIKTAEVFPHQVKAHQHLRNAPRFAAIDVSPGGGKCQVGSTIVPTSIGLLSLKEIWDSNYNPQRNGFKKDDFDVVSLEGLSNVDFLYHRKGYTHKVVFSDGFDVEGLPEHKIYAFTGERCEFVRLDNLKPGDWIPKSVGTNLFGSKTDLEQFEGCPTQMSEDLAELLGFAVAEGCFPPDRTTGGIGQHNDRGVLDYIKNLALAVFDKTFDGEFGIKFVGPELQFMRSLLTPALSAGQRVPLCIRQAPKEYQTAFLRALFEGDGSIYQKSENRWRITYTTISKRLIRQVKAMLENLGIYCQMRERDTWATNGTPAQKSKIAYELTLWEQSNQMFADEIGFISEFKNERLSQALAHREWLEDEAVQNTNFYACGPYNQLPLDEVAKQFLARVSVIVSRFTYQVPTNRLGGGGRTEFYSFGKIARDAGIPFHHKPNGRNRHSLQKLKDLMNSLPKNVFKAVLVDEECRSYIDTIKKAQNQVWIKVVSSYATNKEQHVYDLSVPGPHCYSSNGVMSHNTILLLIDAMCCIREAALEKKVVKPLIIAPSGLVKNWVEDLSKVVGSSWNIIPITTEIMKRWTMRRLDNLIRNAPRNTIVVCGMSVLTQAGKYKIAIGNHVEECSNALDLLKSLGFNYIAVDEAHKVKNAQSLTHKLIKRLCTASWVDYVRLASGTLISNEVRDIVGEASVFSSQIFRTVDEYMNEKSLLLGDKELNVRDRNYNQITRDKLSKHVALVSIKRKEWAFMLPIPIESFRHPDLDFSAYEESSEGQQTLQRMISEGQITKEEIQLSAMHRAAYEALVQEMAEALRKELEKKKKSDDDEDEGSGGKTDAELDKLMSSPLGKYWLQRADQFLIDPLNDDMAQLTIEDERFKYMDAKSRKAWEDIINAFDRMRQTNFAPRKMTIVFKIIRDHFKERPWSSSAKYVELKSDVDYNGKHYIARKYDLNTKDFLEIKSNLPPDKAPDLWKPENRGKILIFCRYNRSVEAILKYMPADLKKKTVTYYGWMDQNEKLDNVEKFKTDPNVQILLANEEGIKEGHNLQCASRLLRVELPWTPGDLEQAQSRIFRPDPKGYSNGEMDRSVIYIDIISSDRTLEMNKLGRLYSKVLGNCKYEEADNPLYSQIQLVDDTKLKLRLGHDDVQQFLQFDRDLATYQGKDENGNYLYSEELRLTTHMGAWTKYVGIRNTEFLQMKQEAMKTGTDRLLPLPETPMLPGCVKLENVPYVPNQDIDLLKHDNLRLGLTKFSDYLTNPRHAKYLKAAQSGATELKKLMEGTPVHTDMGYGTIVGFTSKQSSQLSTDEESEDSDDVEAMSYHILINKVKIKMAGTNDVITVPMSIVYVATTVDPKRLKMFTSKKGQIDFEEKKQETIKKPLTLAPAPEEPQEAEEAEEPQKDELSNIMDALIRKIRLKNSRSPSKPPKPENRVLDIAPMVYNGFLAIEANTGEERENTLLEEYKFEQVKPFGFIKVMNKDDFEAIMDFLLNTCRYKLETSTADRLKVAAKAFERSTRMFNVELQPFSELPLFHKELHKQATGKFLKIYPFVMFKHRLVDKLKRSNQPLTAAEQLYLAVDLKTNPTFKKYIGHVIPNSEPPVQIRECPQMEIRFVRNKAEAMKVMGTLVESNKFGLTEANFKSFAEILRKLKTNA